MGDRPWPRTVFLRYTLAISYLCVLPVFQNNDDPSDGLSVIPLYGRYIVCQMPHFPPVPFRIIRARQP